MPSLALKDSQTHHSSRSPLSAQCQDGSKEIEFKSWQESLENPVGNRDRNHWKFQLETVTGITVKSTWKSWQESWNPVGNPERNHREIQLEIVRGIIKKSSLNRDRNHHEIQLEIVRGIIVKLSWKSWEESSENQLGNHDRNHHKIQLEIVTGIIVKSSR